MTAKRLEHSPLSSFDFNMSRNNSKLSPLRSHLTSNASSTQSVLEKQSCLQDLMDDDDIMNLVDQEINNDVKMLEHQKNDAEEINKKVLKTEQVMRSYSLTQWQRRKKTTFDSQLLQGVFDKSRKNSKTSKTGQKDQQEFKKFQLSPERSYKAQAALLNQLQKVQQKMEHLQSQETKMKVQDISSSQNLRVKRSESQIERKQQLPKRDRELFDIPESRSISFFQKVPGAVVRKFYGKYDKTSI